MIPLLTMRTAICDKNMKPWIWIIIFVLGVIVLITITGVWQYLFNQTHPALPQWGVVRE